RLNPLVGVPTFDPDGLVWVLFLKLSEFLYLSRILLDEGEFMEARLYFQGDPGRAVQELLHFGLGEPGKHQTLVASFVPDFSVSGPGERIDILTVEPLILESDVVSLKVFTHAA